MTLAILEATPRTRASASAHLSPEQIAELGRELDVRWAGYLNELAAKGLKREK